MANITKYTEKFIILIWSMAIIIVLPQSFNSYSYPKIFIFSIFNIMLIIHLVLLRNLKLNKIFTILLILFTVAGISQYLFYYIPYPFEFETNFILLFSILIFGTLIPNLKASFEKPLFAILAIESCFILYSAISFFPFKIASKMDIKTLQGNPEFSSIYITATTLFLGNSKYCKNKSFKVIFLLFILAILLLLRSKTCIIFYILLIINYDFLKRISLRFKLIALSLIIATSTFLLLKFNLLKTFYGRILIWLTSFEMIKDHPFKGVGLGQFQSYHFDYQYKTLHNFNLPSSIKERAGSILRAHNEFLEFFLELGAIPFTLLLILIFIYRKKIFIHKPYLFLFLMSFFTFPFHQLSTLFILPVLQKTSHSLSFNKYKVFYILIPILFISSFISYKTYQHLKSSILHKRALIAEAKNNTEATSLYEQALLTSNDYILHLDYSRFFSRSKKSIMAIKELLKLKSKSKRYDVQKDLAVNYSKIGLYKKSNAIFKRINFIYPKHYTPYYYLVINNIRLNNQAEVIKWYKKSIIIPPISIKGKFEKIILNDEINYFNISL